jgi:hypothetical protein
MKSLSFFLVVYAMCLCPVIYEVNSTRKLSDVYSLDMIMSENGGRFHSSRGRRSGPNRGRGNSFQSFSTTTAGQPSLLLDSLVLLHHLL